MNQCPFLYILPKKTTTLKLELMENIEDDSSMKKKDKVEKGRAV